MSGDLSVRVGEPPDLDDLIEGLPPSLGDVALCDDEEEADANWIQGRHVHLYLRGLSTRCVGVMHAGAGEANIVVPMLASGKDYELAFEVARYLAMPGGSTVRLDDCDESLQPEEIDADMIARRADEYLQFDLDVIAHHMESSGTPIVLFGPIRPFYLGKKVWAEAKAQDMGERGQWLLKRVRLVQHFESEGYRSATIFRKRWADQSVLFCLLPPDRKVLLPSTDLYFLGGTDEIPSVYLPRAAVNQVLGDRLQAVDERQHVVDLSAVEDWTGLLREARQYAWAPPPEFEDARLAVIVDSETRPEAAHIDYFQSRGSAGD